MTLTFRQAEHFAARAERDGDWHTAEEFWRKAADDTADAPAFLVTRFRGYSVACAAKARAAGRG